MPISFRVIIEKIKSIGPGANVKLYFFLFFIYARYNIVHLLLSCYIYFFFLNNFYQLFCVTVVESDNIYYKNEMNGPMLVIKQYVFQNNYKRFFFIRIFTA